MINCNYKVKITDIQNKYRFKIFCAGSQVDLTNYVTFDDYASNSKTGVMKVGSASGLEVTGSGTLTTKSLTYSSYNNANNLHTITKGTLENVITGKDLTTKSYVDGLVGNISTALDTINGEVI